MHRLTGLAAAFPAMDTSTVYGQSADCALIACRELVPDLDAMAGYLSDELVALTEAVAAD